MRLQTFPGLLSTRATLPIWALIRSGGALFATNSDTISTKSDTEGAMIRQSEPERKGRNHARDYSLQPYVIILPIFLGCVATYINISIIYYVSISTCIVRKQEESKLNRRTPRDSHYSDRRNQTDIICNNNEYTLRNKFHPTGTQLTLERRVNFRQTRQDIGMVLQQTGSRQKAEKKRPQPIDWTVFFITIDCQLIKLSLVIEQTALLAEPVAVRPVGRSPPVAERILEHIFDFPRTHVKCCKNVCLLKADGSYDTLLIIHTVQIIIRMVETTFFPKITPKIVKYAYF